MAVVIGVSPISVMPRLDRGIQYAEASRLNCDRCGVLDRPIKSGDDTAC
ncbi:hypothetical protein [Bradyrhizobium amphicarpaeae]|nr:hypothetical protein [Bradyrhizobium amphicarpaeae]